MKTWVGCLCALGLALGIGALACKGEGETARSEATIVAEPAAAQRLGASDGPVLGRELRFRPVLERLLQSTKAKHSWSPVQAKALLQALSDAPIHGLRPRSYDVDAIEAALASSTVNPGELDLLLSDVFLSYASHLAFGRVDPKTLEADWRASRRELDLAASLSRVFGGGDVREELAALAPKAPEYRALVAALARYRSMSWKSLEPSVVDLKLAASGPFVKALTERLVAEGFLSESTDSFTDVVDAAVQEFQRRRGLPQTGLVGSLTIKALNVSSASRVSQLETTLERWRWLPDNLGSRHVRVNIPSFSLVAFADGTSQFEMAVIVGKSYRRTPVFSGPITDVVFNPPWGVPRRLAIEDKLPRLKKDPSYLTRNQLTVFRGDKPVDPSEIDWSKHSKKNFPFQLRQAAGPNNPLGLFKFNIKNEFDVYLHDTNERELFNQRARSLSSGCIRLQDPRRLAEFILGSSGWTAEKIDAAVATQKTQRIKATQPAAMLHLLYMTAWVENESTVHFRDDIDGRDKRLAEAMKPRDDASR